MDDRRSEQQDPPTGTDEDVLELEKELCRLPEISAARVVTDEGGRPTEVHILADTTKHAKQVVRDVQSVALASFGIELDRRIVSVVQLGTSAERERPSRGRRGGRVRSSARSS